MWILRTMAFAGLLVVSLALCACATSNTSRELEQTIHGIYCDPDHSTLIAEETNEATLDRFDDLRRFELYRTKSGHYFMQSEVGYDMKLTLLSRTEAMRVYNAMPDQRLEMTQAFAD
jgi:hypothetical protein